MIFVQKTPYSKLFLGRTFLIVNRFSKFLQHILGHSKRSILERKCLASVQWNKKISAKYFYQRLEITH